MRPLTILLSAVAILFAAVMRSPQRELLAVRPTGVKDPVAGILRGDLRRLDRSLDRVEDHLASSTPMSRDSFEGIALADALADLEVRVSDLEATALEHRPVLLTPLRRAQDELAGREPRPQDFLATLRHLDARICDVQADPEDRVRALEELNGLGIGDARGGEIVETMLDLLEELRDENIRRDLVGHLYGVREPRMRSALLDCAMFDPSRHVRGAAADGLDVFCDDPDVAWALDWLAVNDPDQEVRVKARRASRKP